MKEIMGFTEGAVVGAARCVGKSTFKVLDFKKAKDIIQKHFEADKGIVVSAGLREDWGCTSGEIFEDGEFVKCSIGAHFGSLWATPILSIGHSNGPDVDYEIFTEVPMDDVPDLSECPEWWGQP